MFALDLFNTDHERRIAEGAVDQLEQRRIDDLAMKMDDLVARAKTAKTAEVKAALMKEFQKCKAERDNYFKIKSEAGIPGNVPVEKIPGKEDLLKGKGRSYYEAEHKSQDQKKNPREVNEYISMGSDKNYVEADPYKNYKIYVRKKPFGPSGMYTAHTEIDRKEFKAPGASQEEAVQAIRDRIDFVLNAQKKVTGSSTIDFNVKFATDLLADPRQKFYAKLENINGQPKLVIASADVASDPELVVAGDFKGSSLRNQVDNEGRAIPLPGIPLTAKSLRVGDWIANGRYTIGNETTDRDGNRIFDLTYHSTAHTKSDKLRLNQPAFTLGTARELDEDKQLHVGDPVVVTAPNEFEGKTGEIHELSPSGKFVIINLYNHGKHSMHLSDIAYNEYANQEDADDWYDDADEFGKPGSEFFPEGFQDFNKVEPYAVCLAGKPVKKFDYYEDARRFHDNWKQKLYREGNKAKADKITLMPLNLDEEEQKPVDPNEFRPVGPITIVPPKKLKSGETYQDRNKYWQSQGQAPIYKTNESEGSWIVYDPETKQIKKRFKTHTAGKSYAKTHGLGFASSEFYFDRVKDNKEVAETTAFLTHGPSLSYGDQAQHATLGPVQIEKTMTDGSVVVYCERDGKRYRTSPSSLKSAVAETVTDVKAGMAKIYHKLAPKIERHRDSFLAGQLYDELENYAELHGAEREFKQMMTGARNRAHMDYDTNPGGFQNWFWYLPFDEEALSEEQDTSGVERAILNRIMVAHTDLLMKFGPDKVMQAAEEVAYNVGDVDEIGSSDVSAYVNQVRQILGAE